MTNVYSKVRELGCTKFERKAFCERQNELIATRLRKHDPGAFRNYADKLFGREKEDPRDGDWLACRSYRARLIINAHNILDAKKPLVFFTFVHPYWRFETGNLQAAELSSIKQFVYRRLRTLGSDVIAVGAFEVRLSVELDSSYFWEGHIHLVIYGATRKEVREAFEKYRGNHKRYAKPSVALPIGHLPTRVGYCVKRVVKRHIAFVGKKGVNRRRLPLPLREQIELDLWLLSLPAGSRVILHGIRKHGNHFHRLHRCE